MLISPWRVCQFEHRSEEVLAGKGTEVFHVGASRALSIVLSVVFTWLHPWQVPGDGFISFWQFGLDTSSRMSGWCFCERLVSPVLPQVLVVCAFRNSIDLREEGGGLYNAERVDFGV